MRAPVVLAAAVALAVGLVNAPGAAWADDDAGLDATVGDASTASDAAVVDAGSDAAVTVDASDAGDASDDDAASDAGEEPCIVVDLCMGKDAGDECDNGEYTCAASSCSNGGVRLTCTGGVQTGCDTKQENEECTLGGGTHGFCFEVDVDGSDVGLQCVVDDDGAGDGCNVGPSSSADGHALDVIGWLGLAIGFGVVASARRRKRDDDRG